MSFETQTSHEMRSLKLKTIVKNAAKLAHLTSIPVTLANYRVKSGWLSTYIDQRFPDLEPCSVFETLGTHMNISLNTIRDEDEFAVNSNDWRVIKSRLQD